VKLAGKQVVDQGFTLYAVEDNDKAGAIDSPLWTKADWQ
jgi:hypothetical protein